RRLPRRWRGRPLLRHRLPRDAGGPDRRGAGALCLAGRTGDTGVRGGDEAGGDGERRGPRGEHPSGPGGGRPRPRRGARPLRRLHDPHARLDTEVRVAIDLSGGFDDELGLVWASQPEDPELHESVNAWIWDDGLAIGLPRIGVEAVADQWETHDV